MSNDEAKRLGDEEFERTEILLAKSDVELARQNAHEIRDKLICKQKQKSLYTHESVLVHDPWVNELPRQAANHGWLFCADPVGNCRYRKDHEEKSIFLKSAL